MGKNQQSHTFSITLQDILETVRGILIVLDQNGDVRHINKKGCQILGFSEKEIINKNWFEHFLPKHHRTEVKEVFNQIIAGKNKSFANYENPVLTKSGIVKIISWQNSVIRNNTKKIIGVLGSGIDITKRKQIEKKLNQSEAHFKKLFHVMVDPVIIVDKKGVFLEITDRMEEIIGYKREEFMGKSFLNTKLATAKSKAIMMKNLTKRLMGMDVKPYEVEMIAKDGKKIPFEINALKIDYKGQAADLVSLRDITERKKAEKEREKYLWEREFITDIIVTASRMKDVDEICQYVGEAIQKINNGAYIAVSLYDPDSNGVRIRALVGFEKYMDRLTKLAGADPKKFIFRPDDMGEMSRLYFSGKLELIPDGVYTLMERKIPKPVCKTIGRILGIEKVFAVGFALENRSYGGIIILVPKGQDIKYKSAIETIASHVSEMLRRRQAERKIEKSLREKEVLLQEIHHRVKNNLTITAALLNIQADQIENKEQALAAFNETKDRVYSMALVHEKLYKSEDFSRIDMKSYIESMGRQLLRAYAEEKKISLEIESEDVFLNINQAVPCGLIMNELVTNAIKHGFPDRKKGTIRISCRKIKNKNYELIVQDNGVGISPDTDIQNTDTLGLKLVNLLTGQIDGDLKVSRKPGTLFTITFPV